MQSVRQIQRLNDAELEKCVPPNASWHTDYRDTAYIHVGGLPFELSEGDVLTIFSQYGNPVHVNLIRDKETGKSRGFAFLKYEDQRSCDLAVDNLSGAGVLGRILTVDHARYKLKEGEIEGEGLEEAQADSDDATDMEDDTRRKRRRTSSMDDKRSRPQIVQELELARLLQEHDDDDPMKAYLIKEKKEQISEALQALSMRNSGRDDKHRSHRQQHKENDRYNETRSQRRQSRERSAAHQHNGGREHSTKPRYEHEQSSRTRSDRNDPEDLGRHRHTEHRERRHSRDRRNSSSSRGR